jgi:hypothetical protein
VNFLKEIKRKISTKKPPPQKKQNPFFLSTKQANPNTEQDVNHNCPRHPNLCAPWTILITSLTSVKQRGSVLEKNLNLWFGIFIHSNFSNLFYFSLTVGADVQKNNTMKERFLHFDQNMEKLSIY